jgi:hypothetical protein
VSPIEIDILLNNAALFLHKPFVETTAEVALFLAGSSGIATIGQVQMRRMARNRSGDEHRLNTETRRTRRRTRGTENG